MIAPLQDAAATRIGRASVLLAGGLTASDTSSAAVSVVGPHGGRAAASTPAYVRASARRAVAPVALDRIAPILRSGGSSRPRTSGFYRHHGVDLIGVLRALPSDLAHLSLAQGASTITEQVAAKILYLGGNDHTPWRKLEDAAVAAQARGSIQQGAASWRLPEVPTCRIRLARLRA